MAKVHGTNDGIPIICTVCFFFYRHAATCHYKRLNTIYIYCLSRYAIDEGQLNLLSDGEMKQRFC